MKLKGKRWRKWTSNTKNVIENNKRSVGDVSTIWRWKQQMSNKALAHARGNHNALLITAQVFFFYHLLLALLRGCCVRSCVLPVKYTSEHMRNSLSVNYHEQRPASKILNGTSSERVSVSVSICLCFDLYVNVYVYCVSGQNRKMKKYRTRCVWNRNARTRTM